MEGIKQVSFAQGQTVQPQNKKRNYAVPAVLVASVGGASAYSAHRHAVKRIAEATAKCDETLIRNNLLKFWKWENGVPELSKAFFEKAVKEHVDFAKNTLESKKKFFKGYALTAGIGAAAVTAIVIGLTSLLFKGKKEA